ncbi:Hypothetical protein J6888_01642 [Nakaseomyces glabratus]
MRFRNILLLAANTVFYCTSVLAKTYENQEIVLDSATLGLTTYEDDELMVLKNAKVTLNDFTTIKLPEGISLSGNSVLTITAPSGDGTPYSIVINGKVSIDDESQFIFDGSSLSYKADVVDFTDFKFDINTGADGVFISKNSLMRIKLPKTTDSSITAFTPYNPSIHIGGTYKAPNNSPLAILGKLEVLKSESKVDGYFDDKLWRVDLGPDHIDENGVFSIQNDLSGNIHCQAYIGVYADIFKGTKNVSIRVLGYQGYSVVSPITIDLGEGPALGPLYAINYILLPEGQDGFKVLNLNYLENGKSALTQLGLMYFFDGNSKDVIATAENNVIEMKDLKSQKSISLIGDHNYNISSIYVQGNPDARNGYFSFHKYENELIILLQPISSENSDYTTTIDKGNGELETDLVSHITTKDSDGNPTTIVTTIPLYGPAPPAETKTVDLGNEVTEYLVISYWTTTNEFGGLITTSSTRTYSPPPVTVTATTASDYIESDWISFFITTDEKGDIVTSSTLFNATRDYNLPEAPHTSFGPAPPAVTKTVDLGNEVTEYLVISYWTTTNEFGGLITTNSTATYSPPPVTVTATTASDYIESDWISFFITTDEKGDIVTSSTLFNATRDYIDAQALYTSSSSYSKSNVEESDYTTTIDKGNGDFETDLVSHITTKDSDGKPTTITTTIPLKPSDAGEADYTTTIDKGNGDFETDLVSHITTKDSDGKPTTIITTVTLIEEPDYTSVFVSDGHTITAVVSHVTTTNDIGQTVTTTVTVMSYGQVGEGVYTSAPAYSQPPVTTTTVSADTATATVVISYFPSIGDDGVTRTGTTTISTVSVGGEADYTTTVDRGNGSIETDVISHITTTDSNGNPTTVTTTITNAPAPSISKANIGSDYTTTVVSNGHTFTEVVSHSTGTDEHGHTIVSTVTETLGGQSNGSTVSSTVPVSTVSGAGSNPSGAAGVGGIVNSQKPQSQNMAGQGSGNENPTQAPGTAGGNGSGSGSGSGSVHQSAGNIVPSGSPSVQNPMDTVSPVSGIHSSQTPHSVPSQAQQQGQGQGQEQEPSSRQQAATTVLSPSGSSVNNNGSGFSSTQTASVLQGKGASIRVASSSILFSIIAVIVVGMI